MNKNTICLWFEKDAEGAARFYAETFPDGAVTAVHKAPSDYPDFARFLVDQGIDSLSLNPDTVLATTAAILRHEQSVAVAKVSR